MGVSLGNSWYFSPGADMRWWSRALFTLALTGGSTSTAWAAKDCSPKISVARKPMIAGDAVPMRAQVEQAAELAEFRLWVRVPKGCSVAPDATVEFYWMSEKDAMTGEVPVQDPLLTETIHIPSSGRHDGTRSLFDLLMLQDEDTLQQLVDPSTDDRAVEVFRLPMQWRYDADHFFDNGTRQPSGAAETVEEGTFVFTIAKHHDTATLSLVTQPGRFLFTSQPCFRAPSAIAGAQPTACSDNGGTWTGAVGGSAFGIKVYVAPFIRHDWVGWSASLSTASIALQGQLGGLADDDATSEVDQLYVSPVDLSISLVDFRLPTPMKIDIGPTVGMGLVKDGSAMRWAFLAGVSISTPLVDVFGKRYGKDPGDADDSLTRQMLETTLASEVKRLSDLQSSMDDAQQAAVRADTTLSTNTEFCADLREFDFRLKTAEKHAKEPEAPKSYGFRLSLLKSWVAGVSDEDRKACGVTTEEEDAAAAAIEAKLEALLKTFVPKTSEVPDEAWNACRADATSTATRQNLCPKLRSLQTAFDQEDARLVTLLLGNEAKIKEALAGAPDTCDAIKPYVTDPATHVAEGKRLSLDPTDRITKLVEQVSAKCGVTP
jgi:hypothetical protein